MNNVGEVFKTFLILVLIIYSVVVSMLYWHHYKNTQNYQKEKDDILKLKEQDLLNRESIVVDKEICFRELTKLKTIQSTALDVLNSYTINVPNQSNNQNLPVIINTNEHLQNEPHNSQTLSENIENNSSSGLIGLSGSSQIVSSTLNPSPEAENK